MHTHITEPHTLRDLIGRDSLTIEEQRAAREGAARRVLVRRAIRKFWPACPFDLIECSEQQLRNIAATRGILLEE